MELKITREGEWRPVALGGRERSVHEDILMGRESTCEWEEVFKGEETRKIPGVQEEIEGKVRMGS